MFGLFQKPRRDDKTQAPPPSLEVADIVRLLQAERPDLQAAFDLERKEDRHNIALWFLFHGLSESGVIVDQSTLQAYRPWLETGPPVAQFGCLPISWLMREAAVRAGFALSDLGEPAGQERVLRWYFLEAMERYGWASLLTPRQAVVLASMETDSGAPLIARWVWDADAEAQAQFSGPADPQFLAWLGKRGGIRWPVLAQPGICLAHGLRGPPDPNLPFGVNLLGHPKGRFGIGEDVRMAAQALLAADVPFIVYDIAGDSAVGAEDDSLDHLLADNLPYRYSVFCATGMDTVRAVNLLGKHAFEGQLLIGFWPWELPEFPEIWRQAYTLVDEVWASTHYTRDAYLRSSPVPVRRMPMVVTCHDTEGLSRPDFALPDDRFLFVFAYDAFSFGARKNPDACLDAFDHAFPRGDEPVGLVIKGIRVAGSPAWEALERRAAQDARLFLIDSSLGRGGLLDLYRACDCFVSLHRTEGFGRNIAECMMLGLPVIVTAHSGNVDFTQWDTAALVPARLRRVAAGEYPFGAGQVWADPDIGAAAALMRRMADDRTWRQGLAAAGQQRVTSLYSAEVVGQKWAEALSRLEQQLAGETGPKRAPPKRFAAGH